MATKDRRFRRISVTDWIRTQDIVASNSITTKDLHVTNNLIVDGDITIKGDMNFGDAEIDTLTIKANLTFDEALVSEEAPSGTAKYIDCTVNGEPARILATLVS